MGMGVGNDLDVDFIDEHSLGGCRGIFFAMSALMAGLLIAGLVCGVLRLLGLA